MSRWSASMFVTTATVGVSARKDRSYSSASTTYNRSLPAREIARPFRHASADERGRIAAGRGERLRRHHRRRRLAVRARDAHELAAARHLTQRLRAADDGHAALASALELGMILRHRRRDDERARTLDVRRIVRPDDDAESPQILGCRPDSRRTL